MIRPVRPTEYDILTQISYASKKYWNYPDEVMKIFEQELSITEDYIKNNKVWVYESANKIIAYYSIRYLPEDLRYPTVTLKKGHWLDHMFIHPDFIRQGIGTKLYSHLRDYLKENNINQLQILADPHARKFYEKMGCLYVKEYPSSIEGRTTPYFVLKNET